MEDINIFDGRCKTKHHLLRILELVKTKDLVSIMNPIGSGKDIYIPLILTKIGKVLVSFNTSRELSLNCKYLSKYTDVGRLSDESTYNEKTSVICGTSSEVRDLVSSNSSIYFSREIIIIGGLDTSLVNNIITVAIWRKKIKSLSSTSPRMVLSNTSPSNMLYKSAADYNRHTLVDVSSYTVSVIENFDITYDDSYGPGSYMLLTKIAYILSNVYENVTNKSTLVFLTDLPRINRLVDLISEVVNASIVTNPVDEPGDESEHNGNVVYIVDDMSSSSPYIGNVDFVIDSMSRTRGREVVYIDKRTAKMRASRLNTTKSPVCHRMCTKRVFDLLNGWDDSKMSSDDMYDLIVGYKENGIDLSKINNQNGKSITEANNLSFILGSLTSRDEITEKGKFIRESHMSRRCSSMLWECMKKEYSKYPIYACVCLISLIDSYEHGYFKYPKRLDGERTVDYFNAVTTFKRRHHAKFFGYSDVGTLLIMWLDLLNNSIDRESVKIWALENKLNMENIINVYDSTNKIMESIGGEHIKYFEIKDVIDRMRPIIINAYTDRCLFLENGNNTKYSDNYGNNYFYDKLFNYNTMIVNPPKQLVCLYFDDTKIGPGRIMKLSLNADDYVIKYFEH
ncbi:MAG: hypothetical protein COA94_03050 [Rickettsiales bacterium]|nr:MAG: hypothetical protein COA94_03050 [Rickettsiales bacterium]